ncbi:hypothetical protein PVAND_015536 [Polypedilum vanderplanki]|uniref:BTB domain-containing protein n=1 Tax=Polypedilum vanderplanki TaxID=319348 RepID=A0A9J6BCV5_POLVA|nr:hypothetical protein PVAND_015536 [Polypedilum vanderplanki]
MEVIKCVFEESVNDYCCTVNKETINNKVFFSGIHKANFQNCDVTMIQFTECNIIKFPKNIHEIFNNLKLFSASDCKMELITREHLGKMPNLTSIIIINCGLKKLKGDIFRDLKKLSFISFANNKIEEIDPTLLNGLDMLSYVDFRGNININLTFDSNISNSISLDDMKREIKLKCKSKKSKVLNMQDGMAKEQASSHKFQQNEELLKEHQNLKKEAQNIKAEFEKLKNSLKEREILIKNQRQQITILLAKQSKQEKTLKEAQKLKNENETLKISLQNQSSVPNFIKPQLIFKNVDQITKDYLTNNAALMSKNINLEKKLENLKAENELLRTSLEKQNLNKKSELNISFGNENKNATLVGIEKILNDAEFKDFTINVGESSYKVHKILFAARSATLAEIFKNNPDAQELNLKDTSEITFKAVYDFVYSNQLPDDVNYLEIFAAASRLKIKELFELAAVCLISNVDERNAFDILLISNKFDHEKLILKAFETIQTKIFPDRKLDIALARYPEKIKQLIIVKKREI